MKLIVDIKENADMERFPTGLKDTKIPPLKRNRSFTTEYNASCQQKAKTRATFVVIDKNFTKEGLFPNPYKDDLLGNFKLF